MTRAALLAFAALLLYAQDFSEIKIEQVAKGLVYTEGPAWSPRDGYLIFSDTPAGKLYKWMPGRRPAVFREGVAGPAGNAFDSEGRLYTCETRARRITRTGQKGRVEVLAERWEGKRLNAPNDIVVNRSSGRAYFTDPAFGEQQDHRELDFYGVYCMSSKGQLKLVARPAGRPNGVALSPNGRILYVVNSDERNVRAYDLDRAGDASNERVLIENIPGVPGGVRADEKGNLYVAAKGVLVYTPEGKLLHTIQMNGRVSNCAFGGADGMTLFITAGSDLFRAHLGVKGAW